MVRMGEGVKNEVKNMNENIRFEAPKLSSLMEPLIAPEKVVEQMATSMNLPIPPGPMTMTVNLLKTFEAAFSPQAMPLPLPFPFVEKREEVIERREALFPIVKEKEVKREKEEKEELAQIY